VTVSVTASENKSESAKAYGAGISICIPAFNEEQTIELCVRSAVDVLGRVNFSGEILVIDDCSTDATWSILERLKSTIPQLEIRRHSSNEGIARTFKELYDWAGRDLVFLNSADGQWKMSAVADMLPYMKDYDVVVARRKEKHYGLSRRLISWGFNLAPQVLFRVKTYDAGSVKLVRREIYDIPMNSRGVFAEAERIIRASRRGYRVTAVDVDHFPRKAGKARGAKPSLVIEATGDLVRCWFSIAWLGER
jgi:glycosyltransferase involved in cell wall biosynthesis